MPDHPETAAGDPHRPEAEPPLADEAAEMAQKAELASRMLKAVGHEARLRILCHLAEGEKTVSELEALLDSQQAVVSQQLARLRLEGLVAPRREGKSIHYALADERVRRLLGCLHALFCANGL